VDLHHQAAVGVAVQVDIGLAEDHEQVAGARLLEQLVAHGQVGIHACR
jgi:hypothetical protein